MGSAYSNYDGRLTVADCTGCTVSYTVVEHLAEPVQFHKNMMDKVLPGGLCLLQSQQISSFAVCMHVGWLFCMAA